MKQGFRILSVLAFIVPCLTLSSQPVGASSKVYQDIRKLYPELNDREFRAKLKGAESPFQFLRTFVPYFYLLLSQEVPASLQGQAVLSQSGWCVGDAHPENFGAVVNDDGDAQFAINDVDDAGPCPLYADFLRFLVSAELARSKVDPSGIIEKYFESLDGSRPHLSQVIKDLVDEAQGGNRPHKKQLKSDSKLERPDDSHDISNKEWDAIEEALFKAYGKKSEMKDAFRLEKDSGGSGGLKRYRVLIHWKGEPEIIEFKEISRPGIFPLATAPIPLARLRVFKTLEIEQGKDRFSSYFAVMPLLGDTMLLRPRWKGMIPVDLTDLKSSEFQKVFEDESAILGSIHSRSATDSKAYLKAFKSVTVPQWQAAATLIGRKFKEAFTEANR